MGGGIKSKLKEEKKKKRLMVSRMNDDITQSLSAQLHFPSPLYILLLLEDFS